ncbi:hypothetical protein ACB358_14705 [Serratia nevei]
MFNFDGDQGWLGCWLRFSHYIVRNAVGFRFFKLSDLACCGQRTVTRFLLFFLRPFTFGRFVCGSREIIWFIDRHRVNHLFALH